jgi:hypothetical protein
MRRKKDWEDRDGWGREGSGQAGEQKGERREVNGTE